jgi:large subunit ribosomal protein L24
MKIKKGDRVVVLQGRDRGVEGVVLVAMPAEQKVIVDGVNVARRHTKARSATQQAGIIDKPMPIHVSNVALLEGGKPTRVGYKVTGEGKDRKKVRIAKRNGSEV